MWPPFHYVFFPSPPCLFSQIFFFRLRHFSRELAKASLFSLTNVLPSMVYYNSVSAEVDGIGRRFGLFKTSCGCTSKKGTRPLLTNKFAGGDPHTFLKSAHALFEHPKSFTLSLPSSTPCFHRHLKQIAAPAGTCYLRKHPASSEPAGKALNVGYRKEKKKYYAGEVLRES